MKLTRIAHLTDLHFDRVDGAVVEALLAELKADPPDLVAISGDLTMAAREREFAAAHAFIERLDRPFLAVPGNHDVSPYRLLERFVDPWRLWRRHIDKRTEPVWSNDHVVVVGLNSARAIGLSLDWSEGRLNRRQLERATRVFESYPSHLFRIVVAHHPFALPPELAERDVVGRARMAIRWLAERKVRLVLMGHLHIGFLHNLPIADIESGSAPPPLFLNGCSATSTRLRGDPNGYNVLHIAGDGFAVDRRIWNGQAFQSLP